MSKSRRNNHGYTREQKLIQENQKLKRQLGQLRKQLARIDLDRYEHIKQIVKRHYQEEYEQEGQELLEKLKEEWKCHEPGCSGYLEINIFNKINDTYYYRACNACNHRTKSKRYDPKEVKGIIKENK